MMLNCFSNSYSQQMYFPLNVGNTWQFSGYGPWDVISVSKDTIMSNGKKYFLISPYLYSSTFLRQEQNKIYRFNGKTDELLFDFSVLPKDTITSFYGITDTTDIVMSALDKIVIFGRELRHWTISINWARHYIDDEQWLDIVDSIGISSLSMSNAFQKLYSAKIDNKVFTTTNVSSSNISLNDFKLFQNYPNPFNPRTSIAYNLPNSGYPVVLIFNPLGQTISEINLGYKEIGLHQYDYDASKLSSGVYYYQIKFGSFVETKKFILIK